MPLQEGPNVVKSRFESKFDIEAVSLCGGGASCQCPPCISVVLGGGASRPAGFEPCPRVRCRGPASTAMCGPPLPASLPNKCCPIPCLPSLVSLSNEFAFLVLLPLSLSSSLFLSLPPFSLSLTLRPFLYVSSLPPSSFDLFSSFCCAFSLRPRPVPCE